MDRDFLDHSLTLLKNATIPDNLTAVVHELRTHYEVANITYRTLYTLGSAGLLSGLVVSTGDPGWIKAI